MQVTYAGALKKGLANTLPWLKTGILVFSIAYVTHRLVLVYPQLTDLGNLQFSWWLGAIAMTIAPVNWLLEAKKWQLLLRSIQSFSLEKAFHAVLSGMTLSLITPRALGDYAGRVISLPPKDRLRAIPLVGISRVSQMGPTLIFGMVGAWTMWKQLELSIGYIWVAGIVGIGFSLLPFLIQVLRKFWRQLPGRNTTLAVLGLSFCRYVVFTTQFLLVMYMCGVEAGLPVLVAGITWIFLCKTMLPSFSTISDLGVRELSAVLFFEAAGILIGPVVAASLVVWVINMLTPSILGMVSIYKTRM